MSDGLITYRVPLPCGNRRADLGPAWTTVLAREGVEPDHDVIEEVFILDTYGLRGLPTETWSQEEGGATVIDLGANIGAFTLAALQFGAAWVLAVEPEPGNVKVLEANVAQRGSIGARTRIVEAAVGDEFSTTYIEGVAAQAHVKADGPGGGSAIVQQVTLDSIIDMVDGRIGLLKIDVEGAEYETIAAASADRLARCERIVGEWHGPEMAPWRDTWPIGALVGKLLETHDVSVRGYPHRGGNLVAHRYPED